LIQKAYLLDFFSTCVLASIPTQLLEHFVKPDVFLRALSNFAMLASIWWFSGWHEEELPPRPPPVSITGVRILADGEPAHLPRIATVNASDATDGFLIRIPDLRKYWKTKMGWHQRDLLRLSLLDDRHVLLSQHLQQANHLKE
jgi:hypothetical protein